MCKRCDSTTQEADLSEDLVVDGETFGCVKILCYLGDTLYGDGEADPDTTAWNQKMDAFQRDVAISDIQSSPARDYQVYASCVRISIIYRSTLPHS